METYGPPCIIYIITYVIYNVDLDIYVDLSVELLLGTLDLVAFIVLLQH